LALGPDTAATSIAGYGLILLALVSYAPLIGSSIQRIVGEEVKMLDEYELRLRGRALSLSYATFTGLALLAVLYAAIASDKGAWFPDSYEDFNGVFWGIFLYASVLRPRSELDRRTVLLRRIRRPPVSNRVRELRTSARGARPTRASGSPSRGRR
jgi:hypothetical protein